MKKNMIISAVVASLLLGGSVLYASSNSKSEEDSTKNISSTVKHQQLKTFVKKEINAQNQEFKNAPKEVILGLNNTFNAFKAIENNDINLAKKSLAKAIKEFDIALKADPSLGLVVIENDIQVNELSSGLKQIEEAIKLAKISLEKYNIQVARDILIPLRDDIVITTNFIPMDIYPDVTKRALNELNNGNSDAALQELMIGLDILVSEKILIPIPLLVAEDFVTVASKFDKSKKTEALGLLEDAQDQLKKAVLLGYTDRYSDEYQALSKEIKAIYKEIKGKNEVQKLYDRTKKFFSSLLDKTRSETYKDSVEKKEAIEDTEKIIK